MLFYYGDFTTIYLLTSCAGSGDRRTLARLHNFAWPWGRELAIASGNPETWHTHTHTPQVSPRIAWRNQHSGGVLLRIKSKATDTSARVSGTDVGAISHRRKRMGRNSGKRLAPHKNQHLEYYSQHVPPYSTPKIIIKKYMERSQYSFM